MYMVVYDMNTFGLCISLDVVDARTTHKDKQVHSQLTLM